ncbi:MAG: coenzyme F420-0:L-glutamate ligase [Candidatus Pacebacteria bacterium]|nr:coenzyme F420-0:L-glutamate ligase [Candidatus Paceibacterota bacterium]
MILKDGNKNKDLVKKWNDISFFRYPVKTKTIKKDDTLTDIIHEYCDDFIQDGDIIAIAESVISVTQNRAYKFSEIKYGFFAKLLSGFVTRTPAGIGLGTPQTMQLAINETGIFRILCAAGIAAITKPFGLKGMFYRIAGERARGIDGPTENTLPPYNKYASLLPKNPNKVLDDLRHSFSDKKIQFCIVDANDIGVNLVGKYNKNFALHMKSMFTDNPLGQGSESTPFLIIREF